MNPVETYLKEKSAGFLGNVSRGANYAKGFLGDVGRGAVDYSKGHEENFGAAMGRHLAGGGLAVGGAMLATGAGAGISKLYDAVTKTRDFKAMLEEPSNQDIAAAHQENPRQVNRYFSTLRTFNPEFSRDPLVSGNYMRKMIDSPESAGGIVEQTINYRDKMGPGLGEQVTRAASGGGRKGR